MSDRTNDIRMYVEHLFEGRTLTPETIELKEEIYGNLTARYEDYRAQGMSEDEAYARTCEAVASVDDVLDGEKDPDGGTGAAGVASTDEATRAAGAADAGGGADADEATRADETLVAPLPATAGPSDASTAPDEPVSGTARRDRRIWKIAAAAAVVFVALVCAVAFGLSAGSGRASQGDPDANAQSVDVGAGDVTNADDTASAGGAGDVAGGGTSSNTADGTAAPNGTSSATPDGTPSAAAVGTPVISTDDVAREVASHDAATLSGSVQTSWPVESTNVAQAVGGLPLAGFVSSAGSDANTSLGNIVTVEYGWAKDERVARADGDAVESALTYDAAALLCTFPSADAVQVTVRETDSEDGELDVDVYSFRRADIERILSTTLTAERLTDGSWEGLRTQLSTERTYDQVIDQAERD